MCKLCLAPTTRDLLLMTFVFALVALLMLTTGCSKTAPQPGMLSVNPIETTHDDLEQAINKHIRRLQQIDDGIARLNAIDQRLDKMLLEARRPAEVSRGSR